MQGGAETPAVTRT